MAQRKIQFRFDPIIVGSFDDVDFQPGIVGVSDGMAPTQLRLFEADEPQLRVFDPGDETPETPEHDHPRSIERSLESAIERYLVATESSEGNAKEYRTTAKKWSSWWALRSSDLRSHRPKVVGDVSKSDIADFLSWVFTRAVEDKSGNPGRVHNKTRGHLRAVFKWLATREEITVAPPFPDEREQRTEAGLYYLTADEIDRLYWATHRLEAPRGWEEPCAIGTYWRAALCFFYTYGCDTQTVFAHQPRAKPLLWRHVFWDKDSPDRSIKSTSEWGWIYYQRAKTGRVFVRPMSREVHEHLRSIARGCEASEVVFRGGGGKPCARFQELCALAEIKPKRDLQSGVEREWTLKDLRKTSATEHEENLPGSAVAILGHAASEITYRHYANREPLAFRAVTTLSYPASMRSIYDDSIKTPTDLLFAK